MLPRCPGLIHTHTGPAEQPFGAGRKHAHTTKNLIELQPQPGVASGCRAMEPTTPLRAGSPVRIVGGTYAGQEGTVVKDPVGPKVRVNSPTLGKEVCVMQSNVTAIDSLAEVLGDLNIGAAATPPRRKAPPKSTPPRAKAPFQCPESCEPPSAGGGMVVDRVILRPRLSAPKEQNFLTEYFGSRVLVHEIPLPIEAGVELPGRTITSMGRQFELLVAEVKDDGMAGRYGQTKQIYEMYYIAVSGEGIEPIDLRDKLERVAAFEAQDSTVRKTIARLQLFRSAATAGKALRLTASDFEVIEEPISLLSGSEMCDGCGFIGDEMLLRLLGGGTGALKALRGLIKSEGLPVKQNTRKGERELHDIVAEIEAIRAEQGFDAAADGGDCPPPAISVALTLLALQVRIIGPRVGVGKGVLVRKPGISKIQLPPSMVKVAPSTDNEDGEGNEWVSLIIKSEFPSSTNRVMGKLLLGAEPLSESDKKKLDEKRELSPMISRLWAALGVPRRVINEYQRKPVEAMTHAWTVGVADMCTLPAGHIFVTGLQPTLVQAGGPHEVFITRSPCIKPGDGRMLPVVTEQPAAMDDRTWRWLLALPFGAVVFSSQGDGAPLPASIAQGDLDGDLYFICWDKHVINHVQQRELVAGVDEPAYMYPAFVPEDKQPIRTGETWLAQVQDKLSDLSLVGEKSHVGRLYKAMERRAIENGMDDDEALALGAAYTQALEREKHGGAIHLPTHLHVKF